MKLFIPIMFILMMMNQAFALDLQTKAIYGEDNRRLVSELNPETDRMAIKASEAVLAQISNWRISSQDSESIKIETKNLETGLNFCYNEKFVEQPLVSSCTAFLVAPDLIVTAGHCVADIDECKKQTWVLDFNEGLGFTGPKGIVSFPKDKTYSCRELVNWNQDSKTDYALIRLDRKIVNRPPLKLRRTGKVANNESLMVIGHPLGMPKIMTDNVFVRDNLMTTIFKTNADTFSGNSGSPVIGVQSGLVEGVLIKGSDDFTSDTKARCQRAARCGDKECSGESVMRSTFLPLKNIPKI